VFTGSVPGSEPEIFASGFSAIIDIAFGSDGSLYVLEIAANGLLEAELNGNFAGALIKVAPDGTRTTVTEDLVLPGGIAVGKDGYLYVTNYSTFLAWGKY
jgi:sugar lactone lactonase YvrE